MLLRHLLSILLLPFTVAIVVPALLLRDEAARSGGLTTFAGIALLTGGLALVFLTIHQFATIGRGTLAPWDPPRHLVVRGIYRHVRNPMITGVILIVAGESLMFGSVEVALWAATVFAINAVYIPVVEEPGLVRRFGDDYLVYRQHVPRWVPRATPWIAGKSPEA